MLERLKEWVDEANSQLGLQPKAEDEEPASKFERPQGAKDDAEKASDMRFGAPPQTQTRRYVSYAWNDPSEPTREAEVDRLCDAATTRGAPVI